MADAPSPVAGDGAAPLQVILVGAGIGGLTTALALARVGVEVTLVEQARTLDEVGAGVQLSPNASRVLFQLGLEAGLRAVASAPRAVEVREHRSGRLLLRTELGAAAEARWGAPYLQVHRADLQRLLLRAVERCGRIRLRLGARIDAVEQVGERVHARGCSADGALAELAGDVLIGCDGLKSSVRANLFGRQPPRFTGQVAWRGLVEAESLDPVARAAIQVAAVWTGAGRHFVHYPIRGGGLVNVVAVIADRRARSGAAEAEDAWSAPGDPAAVRSAFAEWPDPVGALARAVQPWRYPIFDRPPLARWSRGSITLLGDAAHPIAPFLAQGAGAAIEDAAALARHLACCAPSDRGITAARVSAALCAYEDERRPRAARVAAWSRRNAILFHLPGPLALAVFGVAHGLDVVTRTPAEARLDWLYGDRRASS